MSRQSASTRRARSTYAGFVMQIDVPLQICVDGAVALQASSQATLLAWSQLQIE